MIPRSLLATLAALLLAFAIPAAAKEPNWPCVQRKVPTLSPGAYWTGPAIDENARWRDDEEISQMVYEIVSRRTPIERAEQEVADFAKKHQQDRKAELTLLFAGVFNELNNLHSDIMRGIGRFMKNQQAKADELKTSRDELEALSAKQNRTPEDEKRLADLQIKVEWLRRIYDDRESTLRYVCEAPVIVTQRLFALGKAIQSHLADAS
jgi:hypothetical protein